MSESFQTLEMKPFTGLCPTCQEEKQKSIVYVMRSSMTQMMSIPYYDEDGRYHNDDPNMIMNEYRCSRGHQWRTSSRVTATVTVNPLLGENK